MPLLFVSRQIFCTLAASAYSLLAIGPTPHPDFPNRLIQERNGLAVEYSKESERYVESVFSEIEEWEKEHTEIEKRRIDESGQLYNLTHNHMKKHREEILLYVANAIGLSEPTELQEKTYDVFLIHYAQMNLLEDSIREMAIPDIIPIWHR